MPRQAVSGLGGDLKRGDAELRQMALPGGRLGELALRVPGQLPDHRAG